MAKYKTTSLNSLALSVALILSTQPTHAGGDPSYIKFALDQAHKQGFNGCDKAISKVFEFAQGDDLRIKSGAIPELEKDTLRMTAVYGHKNDKVLLDTTFRKVGSTCYTEETTMILNKNKSCVQIMNDAPAFKQEVEVVGSIWASNGKGVLGIFHPLGNSCVMTTSKSRSF